MGILLGESAAIPPGSYYQGQVTVGPIPDPVPEGMASIVTTLDETEDLVVPLGAF